MATNDYIEHHPQHQIQRQCSDAYPMSFIIMHNSVGLVLVHTTQVRRLMPLRTVSPTQPDTLVSMR
jgi:hypothetical protein